MFRLELSEKVIEDIDSFVDSYLNSFLSLFVDSGIKDVELIEQNYKNIATKFRDKIYLSLQTICEKDIVFGKRLGDEGELSVMLSVGNYKIFIDYKENIISKTRYIENIEFYKR